MTERDARSILGKACTAIKKPYLVPRRINQCYYRTVYGMHDPRGMNIFEADWDNLVILDACRYDVFETVVDLPGTLEKGHSKGSTTHQWVTGNFVNRTLHDVVYVTANGRLDYVRDSIDADLHAIERLWTDDYRERINGKRISPPETITEHAMAAAREYPRKRLLVHYLQPHMPYLGPTGESIDDTHNLDMMMREHDHDEATLRRAYHENVEIVLDEVAELLATLDGKTVVTADHGENLGERERPLPVKRYGHAEAIYTDELITVPWFVCDHDKRRDIEAEDPKSDDVDVPTPDSVEEHLENLGYM